MQPRIPSFAALTSLSFLAASDLVVAQITAPNCDPSWEWSYNSLNQNPCTVGAYIMGTCNGGVFEIDPLQPGYHYPGPTGTDNADLCKCNTVAYNLISACEGCQNRTWIAWSEFSANCTKVLSPSTFPNPVPAETRVQQWALVDITNVNFWNVTAAQIVGDLPEVLAGDTIGPSSTSTVTTSATGVVGASSTVSTGSPTGSSSVISSISPTHTTTSKKSSNTGAIAGGVVGGVVALAIICGLLLYFLQLRPRAQAPSAAFVVDGETHVPSMSHTSHMVQPQPNYGTTTYMPGSPVTPMKLYDPDDPTTYPGHHIVPTTTQDLGVHVPAEPYDGSPRWSTFNNTQTGDLDGYTPAKMQTAQGGYHDRPTA